MKIQGDITLAKPARHDEGAPRLNIPALCGIPCGKVYRLPIAIRGAEPLALRCEGVLPEGIAFIPEQRLFAGSSSTEGEYKILLTAENAYGHDEREITFRCAQGNCRALTPPRGWTSWNAYAWGVTEEKIRRAAQLLVSTGLAARGYQMVNIDSCWQGRRAGSPLVLQPNEKFPNMAGLVGDIHALGLKAGIYSTPMVHAWGSREDNLLLGSTGYPLDPNYFHSQFGGCGKKRYEMADAASWAQLGFDYLKYDWPTCDVPHSQDMRKALDATGRDFVFSLTTGCKREWIEDYCQCANMLRSNTDTADKWDIIVQNIFGADAWLPLNRQGCWFDLDMLALGTMDLFHSYPDGPSANRLERNEQISHMAMWAFLQSPLQISCRLDLLDDFTFSLLANEDLLDINQDPLGETSALIVENKRFTLDGAIGEHVRVYSRRLAGGAVAYAVFNSGPAVSEVTFAVQAQGIVRDVLAMKDLGRSDGMVVCALPSHATRVLVVR